VKAEIEKFQKESETRTTYIKTKGVNTSNACF